MLHSMLKLLNHNYLEAQSMILLANTPEIDSHDILKNCNLFI